MKRFRIDCVDSVARLPRHAGIVFLALFVGAGCNSSTKGRIHGKVTLDGQPVANGSIAFIPTDGKSPTAGAVIKDGIYTAEVPLGAMRVEIHYPKAVGKRKLYDMPDSPTVDITEEQLPPKYNVQSQLTETITAKSSEINFDLQSK
ncbi:MAG TPA: hypothetical protein VGZ47_00715 [Gemmataceae bacterium]|jgi:hypothetical protein|nr:hypothetical protein [Gemmataceae bacterium]